MPDEPASPIGVNETLGALADVRHAQRKDATRVQRLAERLNAVIANPTFVAVLTTRRSVDDFYGPAGRPMDSERGDHPRQNLIRV